LKVHISTDMFKEYQRQVFAVEEVAKSPRWNAWVTPRRSRGPGLRSLSLLLLFYRGLTSTIYAVIRCRPPHNISVQSSRDIFYKRKVIKEHLLETDFDQINKTLRQNISRYLWKFVERFWGLTQTAKRRWALRNNIAARRRTKTKLAY